MCFTWCCVFHPWDHHLWHHHLWHHHLWHHLLSTGNRQADPGRGRAEGKRKRARGAQRWYGDILYLSLFCLVVYVWVLQFKGFEKGKPEKGKPEKGKPEKGRVNYPQHCTFWKGHELADGKECCNLWWQKNNTSFYLKDEMQSSGDPEWISDIWGF